MDPRQDHGIADVRGTPRKARETTDRFAEEDLRRENQELRELNRVKSDFLALLSHEFRTPLQAIFGYTELLEREIHGPLTDSQRQDIARIQQSEQHLLGLLAAIQDFAKLESGQPVDVSLPQRASTS
jgi:signal transduction histidine kinase